MEGQMITAKIRTIVDRRKVKKVYLDIESFENVEEADDYVAAGKFGQASYGHEVISGGPQPRGLIGVNLLMVSEASARKHYDEIMRNAYQPEPGMPTVSEFDAMKAELAVLRAKAEGGEPVAEAVKAAVTDTVKPPVEPNGVQYEHMTRRELFQVASGMGLKLSPTLPKDMIIEAITAQKAR